MSDFNLLIDGKMVPGDLTMPVLNPATEEGWRNARAPRRCCSTPEMLLAQDFDPAAQGCRLDLARLQNAGERVADALSHGADLVVINRFGKRERDGKGLGYLIERALSADIPVVIAVASDRFSDWITFVGGMSVRLGCDRDALEAWWNNISTSNAQPDLTSHPTVCEILK